MSATTTAGELVLATLYLEPTGEREQALCRAAAALARWDEALVALEAHGVLGLALRNLLRAGAVLPAQAREHLERRAAAMRAIDAAFQLTLERFLAEAGRDGIEVTLLKGAALALDLYPERGLRTQSDLDLLVRQHDVPAAVAAARRIGLVPPAGALPAWWYRLAHFHLKLVPLDGLQRELELHWHLHPPSRLHGVQLEDLLARRSALRMAGVEAWTLDPLDRLLHLVTHLARHSPLDDLERDRLVLWATDPRAPLRLKWLVDIRSEVELRHAALAGAALVRRAGEWNAAAELALVLAWLRAELGFTGAADSWVTEVLAALPAGAGAPRRAAALDRPLPGLDLRPSALRAFPRWVWPRAEDFGPLPGRSLAARRVGHAGRVLARSALAGAALPVAWLVGRAQAARGRARAGLDPEEALTLAARARELARAGDHATSS